MRTLCSIFIYLVIFVFVDFRLNAQVYEPEGINIPGAWNNWTNSNDTSTMDNFRLKKRNFGGGQYTTTLQIYSDLSQTPDATPGTYEWLFTSGPNTWHGMEKKTIVKERRCIQVNYVTFETDWKVK